MNRADESFIIICECRDPEHQFLFNYSGNEYDEFYLTVHIATYKNLLQRIIPAIKYIFGHRSRYGQFDEIIVSRETANKLADWIKEKKK